MTDRLFERLSALAIPVQRGALMKERTTLKVGGPAELLVDARGEADVAACLALSGEENVPVTVIGNGSNTLVLDGGIKGLVLAVGSAMADIEIDGNTLRAGAGLSLSRAAQAAQAAGLSGLEALSGIPGALGGATCMNAGAYGSEMSQVVQQVIAVDKAGVSHTLDASQMAFGYRQSALSKQGLVATAVSLSLMPGDPAEIGRAMRELAAKRREKQPLTYPSAGSFFKRPQGHFAGALIEQAGLKGTTVGGAQVSQKHAGFLINIGGATAQDFLDLSALVRSRVEAEFGVALEAEVRIIGCNSSC